MTENKKFEAIAEPPARFTLEHTGWQDKKSMIGVAIQMGCTEANCNLVIIAPNLEDLKRWLAVKTDVRLDVKKLRTVGVYDRGEVTDSNSLLEGRAAK